MLEMNTPVKGNCPMGCGRTLVLEEEGDENPYVKCAHVDCPRPTAVTEILSENESEHIVEVQWDTFTIHHPLRERLDHELLKCQLLPWMRAQVGPPVKPGRYCVTAQEGDPVAPWLFEKITPKEPS